MSSVPSLKRQIFNKMRSLYHYFSTGGVTKALQNVRRREILAPLSRFWNKNRRSNVAPPIAPHIAHASDSRESLKVNSLSRSVVKENSQSKFRSSV